MNSSNNNSTDYFFSRKQYELSKFWIYLLCIPFIAICGIIGNSLSLYILQKYPTKHAFAIYLKALTAVDTCLLGMSLLRSLLKLFVRLNVKNALKIETYGVFYAGIIFGTLLQRLSSTFITVIAVERLLAVSCPIKFRRMRIETQPVRILIGLICFFIMLQIPTVIFVEVQEVPTDNGTTYMTGRTNLATQLPELTTAYLFLIAGFGSGLPLCLVLASTCIIVFKMNNEKRHIERSKVCRGSIETETMTLTLVALATMFSTISLPSLFIYIWAGFDRSVETTYLRALFVDVNIVLVCINSGSDFIIYCMTSKKFRVLFFESVICRFRQEVQPSTENRERFHVIETISTEFN